MAKMVGNYNGFSANTFIILINGIHFSPTFHGKNHDKKN